MSEQETFEIFLVASPGLEQALLDEVRLKGFPSPQLVSGGVVIQGGWVEVWRANLVLRGVTSVFARIGSFHAGHLAQLDKLARKFSWSHFLRRDVPVRVEVTCHKSRIYHSKAAAQRLETAIREELGAPISADAEVCIKARFDNNLCTLSIDTSGGSLHKRGHKEAIAKAPIRETMASLLLQLCNYHGDEPVYDPMCGSGTFVIEAAEIAARLNPGRTRDFAFEKLARFDVGQWQKICAATPALNTDLRFYGSDRDAGAITMSRANAARAGVGAITVFKQLEVSKITPPPGPTGLVIVNPPYGIRIGDKKPLLALYAALGHVLQERFIGWRVGLITADPTLAKATTLPFAHQTKPIAHGGLRVILYQTQNLI